MTQWLTMDTAPKDGSSVVLLVAGPQGDTATPAVWFVTEWRTAEGEPVKGELLGWWPTAAGDAPPEPTNSE